MKLKTLYFNILRIYYHFKESNSIYNIIYNSKIYDDCIHFQVIKVLLETDNLLKKKFLENEDLYNKMADTFSKNIYLRQIINKITWKNISDRLPYLDELFNNKELIIFERKLNRNIVPDNFDSRLKKIIINEFEMYKYL